MTALLPDSQPVRPTKTSVATLRPPPRSVALGRLHAHAVTFDESIDRIVERVREGQGGYVVTPNVDHVCLAEKDVELRTVYRNSFLAVPDGMPLLWIASALGTPLSAKVSGSDLLLPLMRRAAAEGLTVFFLGATDATCTAAARRLSMMCPKLRIEGWASPLFDALGDPTELEDALEKVRAARPDLLLIAMGSPKQEYVLWRYLSTYAPAVGVGVGASLDFLAGTVRRAPTWMSEHGLEWLYRLWQEPARLWHRYLVRDRAIVGIVWRMRRDARRHGATTR